MMKKTNKVRKELAAAAAVADEILFGKPATRSSTSSQGEGRRKEGEDHPTNPETNSGTLDDAEEIFNKLKSGQFDLERAVMAIFGLVLQQSQAAQAKDEEIAALKQEVQGLKKELGQVKKEQRVAAIREMRNNVIIRGVPVHNMATNQQENFHQTKEIAGMVLQTLGVDIKPLAVRRLRVGQAAKERAKKAGRGAIPPLLLQLASDVDRRSLYQQLPNLKGTTGESWKFTQEVPAFLRASLDQLEEHAYNLRKNQGCKTRIITKGDKLVLLKKATNEKEFTEVTFPEEQ